MAITKGDIEIRTLEDWARVAGPKSSHQWVDGRSAKEVARAWLEGRGIQLPPEIMAMLVGHPAFGRVLAWEAEPEARLCFDTFPGEPRNSDLVVHAKDEHGPFLMAVEAKADESFGETIAESLAASLERYLRSDRSKGIARVQQLAQALLGPKQADDPPIRQIRYQLLTACAGAVCEAERHGYSRTLLLIQEFKSEKTKYEQHRRNSEDLNLFVQRLAHSAYLEIRAGEIQGPFPLPGSTLFQRSAQLFIGKVSRNIRADH